MPTDKCSLVLVMRCPHDQSKPICSLASMVPRAAPLQCHHDERCMRARRTEALQPLLLPLLLPMLEQQTDEVSWQNCSPPSLLAMLRAPASLLARQRVGACSVCTLCTNPWAHRDGVAVTLGTHG